VERAQLRRTNKGTATRGLTRNHNRTLKYVFKGAAQAASRREPFKSWYAELLVRGLRPESARVTVARKIAAVTRAVWKSGGSFEAGEVMKQAARAGRVNRPEWPPAERCRICSLKVRG
jgi:hypothetical protein